MRVLSMPLRVIMPVFSQVRLNPDNWGEPLILTGFAEFENPVHIPVIRNRQEVHSSYLRLPDEFLYSTVAVRHRVLGVDVQVRKCRHRLLFSCVCPSLG